jgi:hypothetical protein
MSENRQNQQASGPEIESTVQSLLKLAVRLPDSALERPWQWGSYTGEGVRLAFFRCMEELRSLAVRLVDLRQAAGQPLTQAQRILGQYHAAACELQAILSGLAPAQFDQAPAEGEWPVRRTLAHILGGDLGFDVVVRHALECHRGSGELTRLTDADFERLVGMSEAEYDALMASPAPALLANYRETHARILGQFCSISDAELELPAYYWEEESHPLRFRLHRFESHTRQHTVQIEKTLAATGAVPSEPVRLARLIASALAEVESARLGADGLGAEQCGEVSNRIAGWMQEIQAA